MEKPRPAARVRVQIRAEQGCEIALHKSTNHSSGKTRIQARKSLQFPH
jgi:hypothetical protein